MNPDDLREYLTKMISDVDFVYNGIVGSVCPISPNELWVCYNEHNVDVKSVDEAMECDIFDGKKLKDVCSEFISTMIL